MFDKLSEYKKRNYVCVECSSVDVQQSVEGAMGDSIMNTHIMQAIQNLQASMVTKENMNTAVASISTDMNSKLDRFQETVVTKLSNFETQQENVRSEIGELEKKVDDLDNKVKVFEGNSVFNNVEEVGQYLAAQLKPLQEQINSMQNDSKMMGRNVKADILDIMRRQNNIIIENAPEDNVLHLLPLYEPFK